MLLGVHCCCSLVRCLGHNISAVGQLLRVRSGGSTMAEESGADSFMKNVAFGAGFGAFFGALTEAYRNPPTPTPSDKVVLAPVKSDRTVRLMQSMGRNAAAMAMVAGIFTVSENVAESVRGVDDPINSAIAGCMAGGSIGIQRKKISYMCAGCLGAAMLTTLIDMGNGDWSQNRAMLDLKRNEKRQKEAVA